MSAPIEQAPSSSRYRFLSRLASGGMAEVYRAVLSGPEGFEKPAVVKRMLPELARIEGFRQMFIDEARLMASLSHRNVVSVLDLGQQPDGSYFIALEFVDGVDLGCALRTRARLSPPLAIHIIESVLRGLGYVHGRRAPNGEPLGIVHRDISPHNVLLGRDGDVKLSDFGIAKGVSSADRTRPGTIRGKLPYMSPEQARGLALDGRSDLFSVGVTLYQALLGRRPFDAADDLALLQQVTEVRYQDPQAADPALDPRLAAVIRRALCREPRDRFANADEMGQALLSCGPGAHPDEVGALVLEALAQRQAEEAVEVVQSKDLVEEPFGAVLREQRLAHDSGATTPQRPSRVPLRTVSDPRPEAAARAPSRRLWWAGAGVALGLAALGTAGAARWLAPAQGPPPEALLTTPPEPEPAAPAAAPASPTPEVVVAPAPLKAVQPKGHRGGRAEAAAEPARVDINSTPWARVTIDGTFRGVTPLYALPLPPGRHRVHLVNPLSNQEATLNLELKAGEVRVLPVNLEGPGGAPP